MKKSILSTIMIMSALMMSFMVQAQTDTTVNEEEVVSHDGKVKIIIKEKHQDGDSGTIKELDRIEIRIGGKDRAIDIRDVQLDSAQLAELEREMSEVEKEMAEVEREINMELLEELGEHGKHHDNDDKLIETEWMSFQIGINNLINADGQLEMPAEYKALELDPLRSINFQWNIIQQAINLSGQKIRLTYGIGIDYNNYRFNENVELVKGSEPLDFELTTTDYKKNKLVAQYLVLPVMLDLHIGKDKDDALNIAFGPSLQYLIGSHQKLKWKDSGTHKNKVRDDFNLERYRIGYEVHFGYGNFTLFGKYFPESIFKSGQGPDVRTAAVGILIGHI